MKLSQNHLKIFNDRLVNFYDAVIQSVTLQSGSHPQSCQIEILAKDTQSKSGWAKVRFEVSEVKQFRFEITKRTYEVLSSGIQFIWEHDKIFIILDAYPEDGDCLPDLDNNIAFVSGNHCEWEISEYME